jgi:hypothetical protein
MTTILPFIRVPDVAVAKSWYEAIGFKCIGTHEEPGCGLDWAMMCLEEAKFMLYPLLEDTITNANNCGLYFNMDTIDGLEKRLEGKARIIETVAKTEYGRKEITFHDCNGFQVTFSSEPD